MTLQVLTGYASIFNIPWETLDDGHKDDCLMVTRMDLIMLLVMVSCGHVKHLQSDSAMFIHRENVWATKSSKKEKKKVVLGHKAGQNKTYNIFPSTLFFIFGIFPLV